MTANPTPHEGLLIRARDSLQQALDPFKPIGSKAVAEKVLADLNQTLNQDADLSSLQAQSAPFAPGGDADAWSYDLDAAPKGDPSGPPISLLLAWTYLAPDRCETVHVGEGYWQADEADWWWANTAPGDYYHDNIVNSITGRLIAWRPMPDAPPVQQASVADVDPSRQSGEG